MRCFLLIIVMALPTLADNPLISHASPTNTQPVASCRMTLSGQLRYVPPTSGVRQLEPLQFYNGLTLVPGERNLNTHPYVQPPITYPLGQTGFGIGGNRPGFDPGYGYSSGPFWPVYGNGVGIGIRGGDSEFWNW